MTTISTLRGRVTRLSRQLDASTSSKDQRTLRAQVREAEAAVAEAEASAERKREIQLAAGAKAVATKGQVGLQTAALRARITLLSRQRDGAESRHKGAFTKAIRTYQERLDEIAA